MTEPAGEIPATPPLNLSTLLAEALAKSSVCWVGRPGDARAAWFATLDGAVLLVTGPGEQRLPNLAEDTLILLRSKDSGGRLLAVNAAVRVLDPADPEWAPAVTALAAERLNATDDLTDRWRESGTVYTLRPYGAPVEAPGAYAADSGSAPILPAAGTTGGHRPFHLGGRPQRHRAV